MFKHRLSKFCKASLFAVCMLLVGGSFVSCQDWLDDYKYDDEEPKWLGASIYDFLKEGTPGHSYENFVELIDSLGEKETLAHTGSKTLFVADDSAFARFFANNPWNVKSISEMSKTQMRYLFYNAMLDNAMLLDMLASTGSQPADEGKRLRRTTSINIIDSVPEINGNKMEYHPNWPTYNQYWDILRGTARTETLKLLMDGTNPMMVHFLDDYLKTNNVQVSDIQFLFSKSTGGASQTYSSGDALVFGNKIMDSGMDTDGFSDDTMTISCKNGYIYRLDNVLLPPSNMADELRKRADTKIFSHLLDRFCVPVYDTDLTAKYKTLYGESGANDSIYRLRYFTKAFTTHPLWTGEKDKSKNPLPDELLLFDPGCNELQVTNTPAVSDMGAMFVPNDQVLYEYFTDPQRGRFLIDYFASDMDVTDEKSLMEALDRVPQVNIAAFVNNLIKPSFKSTVASKFDKVTDDANDPIGLKEQHVDECVIANNGVIYILNNVFAPAAFEAVSSPTLVYENMRTMRIMIKQLRYDYYLLAMDAKYSLLIPDDNHFVYYDPVTFKDSAGTGAQAYIFHYDAFRPTGDSTTVELWYEKYKFNPQTYCMKTGSKDTLSKGEPVNISGQNFGGGFMKNRMTDLLDYLVVVHDYVPGNPETGRFNARQKYYNTKGYGTVKVDASDADNIKIYGGEQIENGTTILVNSVHDENSGVTNGISYCTVPEKQDVKDSTQVRYYSGIPTPPTKSVYANMHALAADPADRFYEFYNLCDFSMTRVDYLNPDPKDKTWKRSDSLPVYQIFFTDNATMFKAVPFFNTYHYTVYVPSNESLKDLFAQGLPSWDVIDKYYKTEPLKAASMFRLLHKFVRYHFQDNSVYLDINPFSVAAPNGIDRIEEASYATSLVNDKSGRFFETTVRSENQGDNATLIIKDDVADADNYSTWAKVLNTQDEENVTWNIMCRDIIYSGTEIATSSFSVMHAIDRPLLNNGLFGYDGQFRRFASNGCLVDTLTIKGGKNGEAADFGGESCYLVARGGNLKVTIKSTTGKDSLVTREGVYLMKELDRSAANWDELFTKEELVLDDEETPVLVTTEGLMLVANKVNKGEEATYSYATQKNAEGVDCRIFVNNDGTTVLEEKQSAETGK